MKNSIWNKSYLYSISGILLLVLSWIIISTLANDSLIFPQIDQIVKAILNIFSKVENLKYIL